MVPKPCFNDHQEGYVMANAVSLFSQLFRHFPRTEFTFLVKKHGAERYAEGAFRRRVDAANRTTHGS